MKIVAVDLGYGYVKGLSAKGKSILFPTLIGPGHDRSLASLFGATGDDLGNLHVRVQGTDYFIGELARESRSTSRVFESERHHHPYMRVLMNAAISLLAEEQDVFLATGLPLDFYKAQAKSFRQSLLGLQPELAWVSGPLAGEQRTLNIKDALIFPQGAGAVFAALLDDNGNHIYPELMSPGTQIGLIDIGFRTTDYIVVEMKQGGAFVPKVELSGTIDVGVVELHRMVRQVYKQVTGGADLDDYHVERVVRDGRINHKGKPILFTEHLHASTKSIAANIADRLKTAWGQSMDLFDAIFLCGGGGELFHHSLQPHFDQRLNRVPNSQFANVIGYMKLAKTFMHTHHQ